MRSEAGWPTIVSRSSCSGERAMTTAEKMREMPSSTRKLRTESELSPEANQRLTLDMEVDILSVYGRILADDERRDGALLGMVAPRRQIAHISPQVRSRTVPA